MAANSVEDRLMVKSGECSKSHLHVEEAMMIEVKPWRLWIRQGGHDSTTAHAYLWPTLGSMRQPNTDDTRLAIVTLRTASMYRGIRVVVRELTAAVEMTACVMIDETCSCLAVPDFLPAYPF
jgi:hypothetical protein